MIRRLIILLLIVGCEDSSSNGSSSNGDSGFCIIFCCEETLEPKDCAGVEGGTAVVDNCGVCDSDLSNDCVPDCADVWGGNAVEDECGVCGGDSSTCEGLWNVYYDVDVPIAGFQFQVNGGNIINASGGAATEAGLSVSNSSSTVVAFSLSGNTIPSGTGTLISLDMEGDSNSFCISNLVLSDIGGNVIPAIIVNCNTIKYSDN